MPPLSSFNGRGGCTFEPKPPIPPVNPSSKYPPTKGPDLRRFSELPGVTVLAVPTDDEPEDIEEIEAGVPIFPVARPPWPSPDSDVDREGGGGPPAYEIIPDVEEFEPLDKAAGLVNSVTAPTLLSGVACWLSKRRLLPVDDFKRTEVGWAGEEGGFDPNISSPGFE
jgi:hypothetical protein